MSFFWTPLPYVALDGGGSSQLALNVVLYVMTLSLMASLLWLAALAWDDRER